MGPDGAGHYVKMVHNGIEYGDMQLICEAYAILKNVLGLDARQLHDVFAQWNSGDLDSFLIDITARIFTVQDPETGNLLVDMILDKAAQKGTGKWTIMSALDLGVVVSTINAAVEARVTSSMKPQRVAASKILKGPDCPPFTGDSQALIDAVRDALYASKIISYAQGMDLLGAASRANHWSLNFGDIATIWRGGCIIRARFLDRIKEAYDRDANLGNLMLDGYFSAALSRTQANWRFAVTAATNWGRRRAGLQRFAGLFRQLPAGTPAGQPASGPARLFRRAHLRARRQARLLPHRVAAAACNGLGESELREIVKNRFARR